MSVDTEQRRARRPDPRVGVALAGAGCALALLGVLIVAGDALGGDEFGSGEGSQLPGIFLSAAVLVAGVLLLTKVPPGPLRTAGSIAFVASIPALIFFLTFDDGSFPPYSTEAILGVPALVWIGAHFVGPAAGRPFPLGAGLIAAWLFVLQVTEDAFTAPFDFLFYVSTAPFEDDSFGSGGDFGAPSFETLGGISLAFGAAMLVLAHRFDRASEHGRATAFSAAALPMLLAGALLLSPELEAIGTGLLLVAIGVVLAASGALRARRITTWAGAAAVFFGLGTIIDDVVGDNANSLGLAAILVGAGLVVGAHVATSALGEPDELVPGPSRFERRPAVTPGTAPPPPAPPDAPPTEF